MSAITALLGTLWPYIAAIGAAVVGAFGLYVKGRRDKGRDTQLKDFKRAERIETAADKARRDSSLDNATPDERLRRLDGLRD